MTFLELKQSVYRDTGYKTAPPSDVASRFAGWLNEAHRHILRDPAMLDLRQGSISFTSVASQAQYAIPQVFERIDAIVQQTNDRRLRFMARSRYRSIDPAERSTGTPDYYVPEGLRPVLYLPNATGLWAVSSSASDITQVVYAQGVRQNGDLNAVVSATLTGTARVALGTVTDYMDVLSFTLSAAAVGTVTLYDAVTSGNVLARIPIGARNVQYVVIRLWPTPTAALPYVVDGQFLIPELTQDTDIPLLPPSYHDILAAYARMKEYERTGDPRLPAAAGEYGDAKTKLKSYVQFPADYRPVAGSLDAAVRRNNLGSWYPADGSLL